MLSIPVERTISTGIDWPAVNAMKSAYKGQKSARIASHEHCLYQKDQSVASRKRSG